MRATGTAPGRRAAAIALCLVLAGGALPSLAAPVERRAFVVKGNVVDPLGNRIFPARVLVKDGRIVEIKPTPGRNYRKFILPGGFIDSHVHVESSMLPPAEFGRMAVAHGTVGVVADPHEIANVLGKRGIRYMVNSAKQIPFKCTFGAPSCVPATPFETSGAKLGAKDVADLLKRKEVGVLSEVMNYPGVLSGSPELLAMIQAAKRAGKPVDGHAPGLSGADLQRYIDAGISTDHESSTLVEGAEKIRRGMKILIREGSAAKNFAALSPLIGKHPGRTMLCSDDKHPDDLAKGHIDQLARRAVQQGIDPMKVVRAACVNPVLHYKLDVGLLRKGDPADFIVVNNLRDFKVLRTYIDGKLVARRGKTLIDRKPLGTPNNFKATPIGSAADFAVAPQGSQMRVIGVRDGQLLTDALTGTPKVVGGNVVSDPERDVLKIAVVNRYTGQAKPSVGFVKGFGLKKGAIAASVAHDSHNIIAVGVTDEDLRRAVNLVIENRGGLALVDGKRSSVLPLPIAGLMSNDDGYRVGRQYTKLDRAAKRLGTGLRSPFMTLSFLALPVIPELKITDRGLFDGKRFDFTPTFASDAPPPPRRARTPRRPPRPAVSSPAPIGP